MHVTVPNGAEEWPTRSLLRRLSSPARKELLDLGTEVRFDADAVLLRQGMNDRHVLVLLSGLTKVTAVVENGETSLLAVRAGGDTVGEMAAIDRRALRSATVTACGPLTARVLHDGALRALLTRRPEVSMALTVVLADRLRWANRRRLDFRGYPAKLRLARVLVELAASYGTPQRDGVVIDIRLTQPELATLIGAAETTVHKVLRELREEGLLKTGYCASVIRDLPRLRQLADLAGEWQQPNRCQTSTGCRATLSPALTPMTAVHTTAPVSQRYLRTATWARNRTVCDNSLRSAVSSACASSAGRMSGPDSRWTKLYRLVA